MVLFSLTVVRHGETAANCGAILQGRSDEPLNENGRWQAARLGRAMALAYERDLLPPLTHALSSDLARAAVTAAIVVEQSGDRRAGVRVQSDARLRERCYGVLEGQPTSELRRQAKQANAAVLDFVPIGAETRTQLAERVVAAFDELCDSVRRFATNGQGSRGDGGAGEPPKRLRHCSSGHRIGRNGASTLGSLPEDGAFVPGRWASRSESEGRSGGPSSSVDSGLVSDDGVWADDGGVVFCEGGGGGEGMARKYSMQSIASDDSVFPDADAHVLLVSHGGAIRELMRHFVDGLACLVPGGRGAALRCTPNTAVSKFTVSLDPDGQPSVTCFELHNRDHLSDA